MQGKQLVANVDARENGVLCLTLYDPRQSTSAEASLNLEMVRDGCALVTPKVKYAAAYSDIIKSLQEAENAAKRERVIYYTFYIKIWVNEQKNVKSFIYFINRSIFILLFLVMYV